MPAILAPGVGRFIENCNLKSGRQNFHKLYLNQGLGTVMHAYLPATQGSINEAHSPYWPGHKRRPYLKNNQAQRAAICLAC
jgi:hypothetical protein